MPSWRESSEMEGYAEASWRRFAPNMLRNSDGEGEFCRIDFLKSVRLYVVYAQFRRLQPNFTGYSTYDAK